MGTVQIIIFRLIKTVLSSSFSPGMLYVRNRHSLLASREGKAKTLSHSLTLVDG
jgi:hypothetical protein